MAIRYALHSLSESTRFSPYGILGIGILKRRYDLDLELSDNVDNDTSFAFSIDFGIEFLVFSPVGLTLGFGYFNTAEADVLNFDAVKEYGAIQVRSKFQILAVPDNRPIRNKGFFMQPNIIYKKDDFRKSVI